MTAEVISRISRYHLGRDTARTSQLLKHNDILHCPVAPHRASQQPRGVCRPDSRSPQLPPCPPVIYCLTHSVLSLADASQPVCYHLHVTHAVNADLFSRPPCLRSHPVRAPSGGGSACAVSGGSARGGGGGRAEAIAVEAAAAAAAAPEVHTAPAASRPLPRGQRRGSGGARPRP